MELWTQLSPMPSMTGEGCHSRTNGLYTSSPQSASPAQHDLARCPVPSRLPPNRFRPDYTFCVCDLWQPVGSLEGCRSGVCSGPSLLGRTWPGYLLRSQCSWSEAQCPPREADVIEPAACHYSGIGWRRVASASWMKAPRPTPFAVVVSSVPTAGDQIPVARPA